jgi:hypothetical protein
MVDEGWNLGDGGYNGGFAANRSKGCRREYYLASETNRRSDLHPSNLMMSQMIRSVNFIKCCPSLSRRIGRRDELWSVRIRAATQSQLINKLHW